MRKKLLPFAICVVIALVFVGYGFSHRSDVVYTSSDIQILEIKKDREKKARPLSGKTIAFFGDSITKLGNVLVDKVAQDTGANCINYAFSGCRMATYLNDVYSHFSMGALASSISQNNFSEQENALDDAGNQKPYYTDTINLLKNADFADIEYICIAYGTNDWNANVPLKSNNAEDINTFEGALRYAINVINNKNPKLKIFVCTPIYRFTLKDGAVFEDSDTKENKINLKLKDYADSIKKVCDEYDITVIDLYSEMDFNKTTAGKYFSGDDGVHPNQTGRALMGAKIAENILKELE